MQSREIGSGACDRFRCLRTSGPQINFGIVPRDPDEYAKAPAAAQEFMSYVAQLAEERRKTPKDDLMSALVHIHEEGDRLSQDELYASCAGLLIGGHETTVHLICNAIIALHQHPKQADLLRANPSLGACAADEFLRYTFSDDL